MSFSAANRAMKGDYAEIHTANRTLANGYDDRLFSFVRRAGDERLIIVSNFSAEQDYDLTLLLPRAVVAEWQLADGKYALAEQLYGVTRAELVVDRGVGTVPIDLEPLESLILRVDDVALARQGAGTRQ